MPGLGVAFSRTFILSKQLIRKKLIDWNANGSINIGRAVIPRTLQNYLIAGPAQSAGYKSLHFLKSLIIFWNHRSDNAQLFENLE